jgi:hypothetical protein
MSDDSPTVSSDRVLEILQRDPLGSALLRAAVAEATVEVYRNRVEQLEQQRAGT